MKFRIKEAREKAGFTQTELARKCGVSRVTIWGIESGSWDDTTVSTLNSIANVIGCTMDDLIVKTEQA
jgi:transcriptional regulator with XRE-family HTH domain